MDRWVNKLKTVLIFLLVVLLLVTYFHNPVAQDLVGRVTAVFGG